MLGCRGACRARLSCRAAVAPPCRRTCQTFAVVDMLGCRGTCRASLSCRSAVAPPGQTVVSGGCRTSLLWRCCGLLRPVVITSTSLPATRKTASLRSRRLSPRNTPAPNNRKRLSAEQEAATSDATLASNRKQHSVKAGYDHRATPRQPTTESCSPAKQTAPTPKATWPATELGICATQAKVAP